jgi:hypothetical protein
MPLRQGSRPQVYNPPNAILTRMRRRIGRVGLLVAVLSVLLTAVLLFAVCACTGVL